MTNNLYTNYNILNIIILGGKYMNSSKNKFSTKTIVLIGLFSAICYVTLLFKIPIPAPVGKPFLHMGNMVVILAALLFSGTIGGLSGSIGMGTFDLLNGWASSAPKTILLKFGIGFITGLVAMKGHQKDAKSPLKFLILASAVLILSAISLFTASTVYGYEIAIPGIEKSLVILPVLYVFSLTLGLIIGGVCIFIKKVPIKLQYAILGAVCGIGFNLVGEFIFNLVELLILGSGFMPALVSAAVSLPATVINGSASIVVAVLLYIPLSKFLARSNFKL